MSLQTSVRANAVNSRLFLGKIHERRQKSHLQFLKHSLLKNNKKKTMTMISRRKVNAQTTNTENGKTQF